MTMTAPTLPTSRFRTLLELPALANPHPSSSMHDSNTATSIRASGCVRREPVMDLTAMMWVSRSALPVPPVLPFSSVRSHVWSCATKVSALGGLSLSPLYFFFRQQDTHLCAAIVAAPNFRSPGLHLELLRDMPWKTRFHISPALFSFSPHVSSYLNFSAIYISFIRQVVVVESCVTRASRFLFTCKWILEPLHASYAECFRYSVSSSAMRSSTSSPLAFP
jgi:hypothetical protein